MAESEMTQDELISMAREAGFCHDINHGIYLCAPMHIERFAALVAAPLQAKIDALMLEYCPDEITDEQMDAWMKHQQPVQECRHCGWLCMPNHNPTKKAYVLQQADIESAVLAEREACAKVCEEIEQDRWNLYKGRPPYTGSESGRADPHEQGVSMGAGECAAAIRARGEK